MLFWNYKAHYTIVENLLQDTVLSQMNRVHAKFHEENVNLNSNI
jgi:hypothetical protein